MPRIEVLGIQVLAPREEADYVGSEVWLEAHLGSSVWGGGGVFSR